MAPSSRANSYYCELCDKTLVPGASFEEHKVGAIHRGLMEVSGKMTRCQFQVFREDLKVGCCKQKVSARRAILEALREPVKPSNWCVPFFLSIVLYRVFFPFYRVFFLPFFKKSSTSWLDLWLKITLTYFFAFVRRNTGLKQTIHWGPLESV